MPQKRNLDALELVRARAHTVVALQGQILATLAGLPSGYNMDYQETKAPFIEAVHLCQESLEVVRLFASSLQVDEERLRAACTPELFATDRAYELVRQGMPFREAYQEVAATPAAQEQGDLVGRLRERTSEGAPGNLGLEQVADRIQKESALWEQRRAVFFSAIEALTGKAPALL